MINATTGKGKSSEEKDATPASNDDFAVQIHKSNERINRIFDAIKLTKNVDLCFVIDATQSMSPHINGVKDSINRIMDQLIVGRGGEIECLRLAMVVYRDYYVKRFESLDFTLSVDGFCQFCSQVVTIGNDDFAEDVLGGLNESLKLSWDEEKSGTKLIFHIGDSPCHGKEFHSGVSDRYPSGDIYGLAPAKIFAQIRKKDIQYSFGKITSHTDIMLKKFAEVYQDEILIFDIKNVDLICKSVVRSVQASVWNSGKRTTSTTTGKNGKPLEERKFVLTAAEPNWKDRPTLEGVFITYEVPISIDAIIEDMQLKRNKPERVKIKVAGQPFARGAERITYYGQDVTSELKSISGLPLHKPIVLKEYVHEYPGDISKRFENSNEFKQLLRFWLNVFVRTVE